LSIIAARVLVNGIFIRDPVAVFQVGQALHFEKLPIFQ